MRGYEVMDVLAIMLKMKNYGTLKFLLTQDHLGGGGEAGYFEKPSPAPVFI